MSLTSPQQCWQQLCQLLRLRGSNGQTCLVDFGHYEMPENAHYAGFPPFRCRSAVGGQPISVLVTSNAVNGKTFPAIPFSPATAAVATERKNGNGMVETRHYSPESVAVVTATAAGVGLTSGHVTRSTCVICPSMMTSR